MTDKKSLILESMLELVKDHGFHGCPVSMVAKNAGVAAGTIYHYYEGKDQLITDLYHYVTEVILEIVKKEDDPSLDFKSRYLKLWNVLTDLYTSRPSIQRFFEQFIYSPYYTEELQEADNKFYNWLKDFFAEGMDKGFLRAGTRPEILSIMVHGSIINSVRVKVYHSKKVDRAQINLEEIPEVVWDGIKKQ